MVEGSASAPLLSVVVVIVSDTTRRTTDVGHLVGCLEAFSRQLDPPSCEIIVPYHARTVGVETVRQRFPQVRLLAVREAAAVPARGGGRDHHDVLRARGLAAARGQLVGLIEDHGRPDPAWCATAARAHREPHAAIGGAIENEIDRTLNWAVYYCDFGRYQRPLPVGPTTFASDANIVYKRSALDAARERWQDRFQEPRVNAAVIANGGTIHLDPEMVVYQHRERLRVVEAVRERYIWGRSYASTRTRSMSDATRIVYALLAPALPVLLTMRVRRQIVSRHPPRSAAWILLTALLLTTSWSIGELLGYVTASSGTAVDRAGRDRSDRADEGTT